MAHADWIIDPGPGDGHDGGRTVFEGVSAEPVAARSTLTGLDTSAARLPFPYSSLADGDEIIKSVSIWIAV